MKENGCAGIGLSSLVKPVEPLAKTVARKVVGPQNVVDFSAKAAGPLQKLFSAFAVFIVGIDMSDFVTAGALAIVFQVSLHSSIISSIGFY